LVVAVDALEQRVVGGEDLCEVETDDEEGKREERERGIQFGE
jgi:hypothetical protein